MREAGGRRWNFNARQLKWMSEWVSAVFCAVQLENCNSRNGSLRAAQGINPRAN